VKLSFSISGLLILIKVLLIVMAAEASVMFVLMISPVEFSPFVELMVDAALLGIISSPFLFWLVIKPFKTAAIAEAEKFRNLLDSAPDGILGVAPDGKINFANGQALMMFGYSQQELVNQLVESLIPERFAKQHPRERGQYFLSPSTRSMGAGRELFGQRKDGTEFPVGISLSHLKTVQGSIALAIVRDITSQTLVRNEIVTANRKLKEQMEELQRRTLELDHLNEMGEMLQACMNIDEACEITKQYGKQLFPSVAGAVFLISPSRDVVEPMASWGNFSSPLTVFSPDACWALRRGRIHTRTEIGCSTNCHHVDPTCSRSYLCIPLLAQGDALGVLHLLKEARDGEPDAVPWTDSKRQLAVAVADDIGLAFANLRLREALRNQSICDSLTGLYNRRFVEEWLHREIPRATRNKYPIAAIMFDLDHFKRFNDTFGHEGGDLVLREFGSFLLKQIREGDIACRFGGEEFAVLMPGTALDVAVQRTEVMRKGTEDLVVRLGGQTLGKITLSAGVACFPEHGTSAEQLFKAADDALYRAKGEGRNRVIVAEPRRDMHVTQ